PPTLTLPREGGGNLASGESAFLCRSPLPRRRPAPSDLPRLRLARPSGWSRIRRVARQRIDLPPPLRGRVGVGGHRVARVCRARRTVSRTPSKLLCTSLFQKRSTWKPLASSHDVRAASCSARQLC